MWKIVTENLLRGPRTVKGPKAGADGLAELAGQVDALAQKRLGRSLSIREVDAGSCNGCELEIHALNNPFYDLERFGLRFVASPRHADLLLVTGPVTHNMAEALRRTYNATPAPKWGVAAGDCAANCGVVAAHSATISYESIDVLLDRPPKLDLGSLQQKMIAGGRGGYCFEQNMLFRAGLRSLGFRITSLQARVVRGLAIDAPRPALHMVLRVDLPEGAFLADVGFGNLAPTAPLALSLNIEQETPHETMRFI